MTDPFRRLILDTVSVIVKKEPNGDSLIELLKVATPDLDESEVIKDSNKRDKLFRVLQKRIHPDHHSQGDDTVTALFQDVQPFYDRCVANIHKRPSKVKPKPAASTSNNSNNSSNSTLKSTTAPPRAQTQRRATSIRVEFEFDVRKKWPYLSFDQPSFPIKGCSADGISALVAYQCINARGAIAHGRKTERFYSMEQVLQKPASVHEKFTMRGGVKQFQAPAIEAIKAEIVTNGPVVSTSFVLTDNFAKRPENRGVFLTSQIAKVHPVLIIGWRVTNMGDMWLCQPLKRKPSDNTVVPVPFGQFGIDVSCLAPKNTFEHVPWQNGPYFDIDMSYAPEWRTWPSLRIHLSSQELEAFGECLDGGTGMGIIGSFENKASFVVRHKGKFAHSRRCRLREVKYDKKLGKW
eukprot:CAMPEP_0178487340 /NCGR_PEP_ID=MMETSP0696-20121128/9273_1 /TAXON_ID=265572 /ORGANISM="Extubocellulus spinifer, Strain CCMP396" /LENGTH=405 /DNA_ID=CAMNT_0020115033 /DNA_START=233 /DNA_END=1447 /DNA_ORIENTATION=+